MLYFFAHKCPTIDFFSRAKRFYRPEFSLIGVFSGTLSANISETLTLPEFSVE